MAIYRASLRTTRMNAVVTDIGSSGKLKLYAGATLLGTLPLSATAGTVSGDVLTFSAITSDTSADNNGVADSAKITTSADVEVISLTVGGTAEGTASGKELVLAASTIVAGQSIAVTSLTITHAS